MSSFFGIFKNLGYGIKRDETTAMKQIVFTDLDGTLLDPQTYSYEKSLPALNQLKEHGIPVIFCSAKTRAEQEIYRRELGLSHPFIAENGGAVFIPRHYLPFAFDYHKSVDDLLVIELAIPYHRVRKLLSKIREKHSFTFRGFGDMSASEIAEITGLEIEFAKLAKQREYGEPVKFTPSGKKDISNFVTELGRVGLNWTYGGQLYHVTGGSDKGKAVKILIGLYRKMWGEVRTVGLGNSLNDLAMLAQVDIPILVQTADGGWEDMDLPRLYKVRGIGPEGWSNAVTQLLSEPDN